jgi:prephenate dehydrogenase
VADQNIDLPSVMIIGSGLIGTSIGLALSRIGVTAMLSDSNPAHIQTAIDLGAGVRQDPSKEVDLVIVAVPPGSTAAVIEEAAAKFPDASITDVASAKTPVLKLNPELASRVVAGHPMAGRELSGPSGARADLFDDRLWILTPTNTSEQIHIDRVTDVVRAIGAAPITMGVQDHDEAVALISHVPQVLASVLAGELEDAPAEYVSIAGQGLRDMTRIAGSNVDLWTDILCANAGPISAILQRMEKRLHEVRIALNGDRHALTAILQAGLEGQLRIPGKHGAQASPYVEIPVMVEDRPGQLAALLVTAGEADINLEDVRIEHVLGRPSGLIELSVRPEQGAALVEVLRARGFDVRI